MAIKDDLLKPSKPTTPVFGNRPRVNPLETQTPEDVTAARKVFDDSLVALNTAKAGRNEANIPLSDPYWGAVNAHRAAYSALKSSLQEIPVASPPDSDMMHDVVVAVEAIRAGEPKATAMSALLSGEIKVPVQAPDEFRPFVRAEIPLGMKLETAAPQPVEETVITIPPPVPPTEEIPPPA